MYAKPAIFQGVSSDMFTGITNLCIQIFSVSLFAVKMYCFSVFITEYSGPVLFESEVSFCTYSCLHSTGKFNFSLWKIKASGNFSSVMLTLFPTKHVICIFVFASSASANSRMAGIVTYYYWEFSLKKIIWMERLYMQ
jgi:hypothetical protein